MISKLYGLVICGGKSLRMGADKSLLNYHGVAQRYYLYQMMQPLCVKVFISCNSFQVNSIAAGYDFICDAPHYKNIGPMAALLSAFESYHEASFLTVGCDYPFAGKEDLQMLIESRNEKSAAVSFYNKSASIAEPLLAIYETMCYDVMKRNFIKENYSLRYFLDEINALQVMPSSIQTLLSIDTPAQYQQAIKSSGQRKFN